jgi:hypothetical protein
MGGRAGEASIRVHAPSWKTKLRHRQVNEYYLNCAEMVLSLCQRNRVVICRESVSTSKEREAKYGRSIGSETCESRNHTKCLAFDPTLFPLIHA